MRPLQKKISYQLTALFSGQKPAGRETAEAPTSSNVQQDENDNVTFTSIEELNVEARNIIYSPIAEEEMRIVKIQPGQKAEPLQGSLVTVERSSAPSYDALSYEWGSQRNASSMLLDGQTFRITRNLERALLRLRHPQTPKLVWIDALAINQLDTEERNAQVRRMAETYQFASTVFIWLGEGNKNVSHFLNWVAKIGRVLFLIKRLPSGSNYRARIDTGRDLLATLSYWSRAWVLQEVTFAKKPVLIYDYDFFDFLAVGKVIDQGAQHEYYTWHAGMNSFAQMNARLTRTLRLSQFIYYREEIMESSQIDFLEWIDDIVYLGPSKSSNPLDKVFGYYSLFAVKIRENIPIDYNVSIQELYSLVTRLVIQESASLVLLSFVPSRRHVHLNLPSWTLDLSGDIDFSEKASSSFLKRVQKLHKQGAATFYSFDNINILHVKGRSLGSLSTVAKTLDFNMDFATCTHLEACMTVDEQVTKHWKRLLDQLGLDESESVDFYERFHFMPHVPRSPHEANIQGVKARDFQAEEHKSKTGSGPAKMPGDWPDKLRAAAILNFQAKHVAFKASPPALEDDGKKREQTSILGFATSGVKAGDEIVSVLGCHAVLVLRPEGRTHSLVAIAMIPGFEEMEAIEGLDASSKLLQDYFLK